MTSLENAYLSKRNETNPKYFVRANQKVQIWLSQSVYACLCQLFL